MADYTSNVTAAQAARKLIEARRIVVTTHGKPDGDAFGAVIALTAALKQLGKDVSAFFIAPVPANFLLLKGADLARIERGGPSALGPWAPATGPDLVVIVDTGAWAQLSPWRPLLEPWTARTLIVDHHLSGDVPAAWRYIDAKAGACCELIAPIIDELAAGSATDLYSPVVSEALFVGVAEDTGWFRFSNARPQTHELAARLLSRGVEHAELYRKLAQMERFAKLALLSRALASLRLVAGGRAALMVLRREDFAQTGALMEETERFVDVPQMVEQIEVVVLVTDPPEPPEAQGKGPGAIRLSFRSKATEGAVNVAELAKRFGGGGHARAAGAKVAGPVEIVLKRVETVVVEALAARAGGAGRS